MQHKITPETLTFLLRRRPRISYDQLDQKRALVELEHALKVAGLGLLISGWLILVAALPLLPKSGERSFFVAAGLALELVGLILLGRANRSLPGANE